MVYGFQRRRKAKGKPDSREFVVGETCEWKLLGTDNENARYIRGSDVTSIARFINRQPYTFLRAKITLDNNSCICLRWIFFRTLNIHRWKNSVVNYIGATTTVETSSEKYNLSGLHFSSGNEGRRFLLAGKKGIGYFVKCGG